MLLRLKHLLRQLMVRTPFEIRRRLPVITLDPLDLLLASYEARGEEMTILQVGACDGTNLDPIHHHVSNGYTHAILLEPNPFAFCPFGKNLCRPF